MKVALENFAKAKYDELEERLKNHCNEIIEQAIGFRLNNPNAHDFTGNLLNSIVVALYRNGQLVYYTIPNQHGVEAPFGWKMTAPKKYYFSLTRGKLGLDYSKTEPSSYYEPAKVTNGKTGIQDAQEYIHNFKPDKKAVFQIVVAYTADYAEWVETTTGYLRTVQWIQINTGNVIK